MDVIKMLSVFSEPVANLFYMGAIVVYQKRTHWPLGKLLAAYYGLAALLMMVAAAIVISNTYSNNIWLYDIVAAITSVVLGYYFYALLQTRAKKIAVLVLSSAFLVYSAGRHLLFSSDRLFDSLGYALLSASIAVYVFMYFHQLISNVTETDIFRQFDFWLASAYLVYFTGNFIIFSSYYYLTNRIMATYTTEERDLMTSLWAVHNVLLLITGLTLLISSLWLTSRKKSMSLS